VGRIFENEIVAYYSLKRTVGFAARRLAQALDGQSRGLGMNKWEDVSKALESIAKSFSKDSIQYKALEEAAWALVFVNMEADIAPKFKKFRSECGKELSESQKQNLRQMGIEP
jgi:hypothetical protein